MNAGAILTDGLWGLFALGIGYALFCDLRRYLTSRRDTDAQAWASTLEEIQRLPEVGGRV